MSGPGWGAAPGRRISWGTRNPLATFRALADTSGYTQPNEEHRSCLLVDGAQLVPGSFTDVASLGADFRAAVAGPGADPAPAGVVRQSPAPPVRGGAVGQSGLPVLIPAAAITAAAAVCYLAGRRGSGLPYPVGGNRAYRHRAHRHRTGRAAAAHPPALRPLPGEPGRVLGQPAGRGDAPPLVPVLLRGTGPGPGATSCPSAAGRGRSGPENFVETGPHGRAEAVRHVLGQLTRRRPRHPVPARTQGHLESI